MNKAHNARLSGEQRYYDIQYYTVNTKAKLNQNRRALRIRLKAFVMSWVCQLQLCLLYYL